MPIRIEHQPSPYAVGLAAWQIGAGAAKQRQQKYALDLFQDQQQFQQQQNLLGQRQQWMDERDAKKEWGTIPSLSRIPDYVDAQTRKDLADKAAGIRDLRSKFSYDDAAAQQSERELREQYEDIIARQAPPSEAEAWNRGLTYVDEKTGQGFDKPGEGLVPYSGGRRAIDNSDEQAAAKQQQAAAEKQQAAFEKAEKEWTAERIRRVEKMQEKIESQDSHQYSRDQLNRMAETDMLQDGLRRPVAPAAGGVAAPSGAAGTGVTAPSPAPAPAPAPSRIEIGAGGEPTLVNPQPVAPQPAGAQGGGPVQDVDGMIDLTTRQVQGFDPGTLLDAGGVPADFTDEMLRQARRIAQTPAGRAALQERYGVDFLLPDEQQQPTLGPQARSDVGTVRQHVEAQRGPQGTGEGILSDRARLAGGIEGAGGLAGREAASRRGELGQGQTRTTKYNVTPVTEERESSMDERYARADAERERKKAAGEGVYAPASASPSVAASDLGATGMTRMAYEEKRRIEQQRRKTNLQASSIRITTEAEYDRLRPGTYFTGPDGKVRRKP